MLVIDKEITTTYACTFNKCMKDIVVSWSSCLKIIKSYLGEVFAPNKLENPSCYYCKHFQPWRGPVLGGSQNNKCCAHLHSGLDPMVKISIVRPFNKYFNLAVYFSLYMQRGQVLRKIKPAQYNLYSICSVLGWFNFP